MRNWIKILLSCVTISAILTACQQQNSTEDKPMASRPATVIKIAATAVPHIEILEFVQPLLAKQGIKLNIIQITDYAGSNMALANKEIDANFFQTIPYLEAFQKSHHLNLSNVANIHIEPMGIYSRKITSLRDLKEGDQVAIPNDFSNDGRALALMQKAGLITLKNGVGINGTPSDIIDNPKHLKIIAMSAAQLPRVLDDVALAAINTNFALEAKLNPGKDALFLEQKDSPYVNILVVRQKDENKPEIQALKKVLTSSEVKDFINQKYQGAVVPAF
ncbi:MetQ/NlpA family ABC transporter substrate-binding protein [Neisseriaceae bacterium ESL0693]|nr:MetQ/NlpA family ABC transporter substrate-binding protein [Neisseriaceae bacterium ESL0693]